MADQLGYLFAIPFISFCLIGTLIVLISLIKQIYYYKLSNTMHLFYKYSGLICIFFCFMTTFGDLLHTILCFHTNNPIYGQTFNGLKAFSDTCHYICLTMIYIFFLGRLYFTVENTLYQISKIIFIILLLLIIIQTCAFLSYLSLVCIENNIDELNSDAQPIITVICVSGFILNLMIFTMLITKIEQLGVNFNVNNDKKFSNIKYDPQYGLISNDQFFKSVILGDNAVEVLSESIDLTPNEPLNTSIKNYLPPSMINSDPNIYVTNNNNNNNHNSNNKSLNNIGSNISSNNRISSNHPILRTSNTNNSSTHMLTSNNLNKHNSISNYDEMENANDKISGLLVDNKGINTSGILSDDNIYKRQRIKKHRKSNKENMRLYEKIKHVMTRLTILTSFAIFTNQMHFILLLIQVLFISSPNSVLYQIMFCARTFDCLVIALTNYLNFNFNYPYYINICKWLHIFCYKCWTNRNVNRDIIEIKNKIQNWND